MGTRYDVVCDDRDRTAWLKARREGLGASDAAAIMGLNPYSSAMQVFAEKSGTYGEPIDRDPSEPARWGRMLEPLLLDEFSSQTGRPVKREGRLLRSRSRPWQLVTLDARQYERPGARSPGLLEGKTTKFDWDGVVPADVHCQVQHQFAVTGWEWGHVACWNRTSCEFSIFPVEPEPDYIAELIATESRFWKGLVDGVPPDPDESESATRALKALYPKPIEGKVVKLDGEMLDVTDDLELVNGEISTCKDRKRALENQIKAAIGDAEAGLLPNGVFYTHRLQHRKETIQHATSFRVLRRKEARNGI